MAPRIPAILATASVIAALGACDATALDSQRDPLVGGVAAPEEISVVALRFFEAGAHVGGCTGTLVAPDVVLTAAHCAPTKAQTMVAHFGPSSSGDDPASLGERAVIGHEVAPAWNGNQDAGHDLALFRLASPAPAAVVPAPVLDRRIDLTRGRPLVLVGYGLTLEADDRGDRHSGASAVSFASPELVFATALAGQVVLCDGDSGGPIFATVEGVRTVVAVASFSDVQCRTSSGGSRIDADLPFVDRWLGADGAGKVGAAACAHALCEGGAALAPTCDPCVAAICARDPFCCTNQWDAGCTQTAELECPATCDKADAVEDAAHDGGCAAGGRSAGGAAALLLVALVARPPSRRRRAT